MLALERLRRAKLCLAGVLGLGCVLAAPDRGQSQEIVSHDGGGHSLTPTATGIKKIELSNDGGRVAWLYQQSLNVRNRATAQLLTIPNVTHFSLAGNGETIAYALTGDFRVYLRSLLTGMVTSVPFTQGFSYLSELALSESGSVVLTRMRNGEFVSDAREIHAFLASDPNDRPPILSGFAADDTDAGFLGEDVLYRDETYFNRYSALSRVNTRFFPHLGFIGLSVDAKAALSAPFSAGPALLHGTFRVRNLQTKKVVSRYTLYLSTFPAVVNPVGWVAGGESFVSTASGAPALLPRRVTNTATFMRRDGQEVAWVANDGGPESGDADGAPDILVGPAVLVPIDFSPTLVEQEGSYQSGGTATIYSDYLTGEVANPYRQLFTEVSIPQTVTIELRASGPLAFHPRRARLVDVPVLYSPDTPPPSVPPTPDLVVGVRSLPTLSPGRLVRVRFANAPARQVLATPVTNTVYGYDRILTIEEQVEGVWQPLVLQTIFELAPAPIPGVPRPRHLAGGATLAAGNTFASATYTPAFGPARIEISGPTQLASGKKGSFTASVIFTDGQARPIPVSFTAQGAGIKPDGTLTNTRVARNTAAYVTASTTYAGRSLAARKKLLLLATAPLVVDADAGGHVSAGFAGTTERVLGRRYTITAVAESGFRFAGWQGDIVSAKPSLAFTMREGLTLHAVFVPLD